MSLQDLLSIIASCLMIFGGVVPYIPQYRDIMRSQNAGGFSLFVCLTLLIANTLRILFWFGHPFETPLLIQSIVMNTAMFAMIQLCVSVQQRSEVAARRRSFADMNIDDFWRWTDFSSYIQFMAVFTLLAGVVTFMFIRSPYYVELLGLLALMTEAMLGVPQFYRNYINKSTEGMSVEMVLLWTCGDIFKTSYFVLRQAPSQFWLCGSAQVMLDFAIMVQVFYYSASTGNHRRASDSNIAGILAAN